MLRHLTIGPASIQTAPLLYLIGFALLTEITRRVAAKRGLNDEAISNSLFVGLISGVIAARISFVVQHWAAYEDNLSEALSFSIQALDIYAGLLVCALIVAAYSYWRGVKLRPLLDSLAPGIGVLLLIVPLGFLAEGSVIGQPSDVPWHIDLWSEDRHPTQIYASIGSAFSLLLWWRWPPSFAGQEMLIITTGNALTWLAVGFLLAEPLLILNYRAVQLGAWFTLILSVFLWNLWEPESVEWRAAQ